MFRHFQLNSTIADVTRRLLVNSNKSTLGIAATGGNSTFYDNNYNYHVFTSPGSFTISESPTDGLSVDYLIVGGGGGGGTLHGGGGGGGGLRTGTIPTVYQGSYSVVVGAGGSGCRSGTFPYTGTQTSGQPSYVLGPGISSITATGGGAGAGLNITPGLSGGSGGGGDLVTAGRAAGNTPPVSPSQGNPGGNGIDDFVEASYAGGGGGGAGGAGADATSSDFSVGNSPASGGAGGIGSPITWISTLNYGTSGPNPGRYFAGGGGGSVSSLSPGTAGVGGTGGGGAGGKGSTGIGITGTANTGGGGGAGGNTGNSAAAGGPGGSGIVILRYPTLATSVVTNSLILNLDAGNVNSYSGTGNTWTDLSGNGNHATLYNSPTWTSNTFTFNGSNQYAAPAAGFANFTTGLTIIGIVNFNNASNWERIIDFGNGAPSNNILFARSSTTTTLNFAIYTNTTASLSVDTTNAIVSGIAFYAVTLNGTNCVVYRNGTQINSTATAVLPPNVTRNNCYIGRSNWAADAYFESTMHNIMIYNRGLTAAEISQNFNALKGRYGL